VSGYVRPRLTDKQAHMLRELIAREFRLASRPITRTEAGMMTRTQAAIDTAFEVREERRRARHERRPF
jgi:hypothetical protein